jgi:outer membrane receptor protein involved in Fe transport
VDENIANGDLGSKAILRSSRNDHEWYGVLSNFSTQLTDELNLTVGVDLRKYVGKHFREVTDLLGGEYFIDSYTGSNGDINNPYKTVKVGDKIGYDNDGKINWYGGFTQLEYNLNDLSTFVSGAYSYTTMQRIDYFKYKPENQESEVISFPSYSVKGGANYNINASLNVFANAGYFSRYPDFNVAFPNNANVANDKAQNEKTLSFELGAGFRSDVFSANLNIYHTQWMDKNYVRRFTSGTPVVEYFANISGLDARHQGVELDFVYKPIKSVEVTGMVSLGDWTWTNNVQRVLIYDDASKLIGTTNVFVKGLHVGDAAQKTAALGVSCELMKGLKAGIDWNYYRDLYADFDPTVRSVYDNQAIDYPDSWKLPNYSLLDMFVRYNFEMGGLDATFSGKVNNLLDVEYITEASDGSSNNWDSAQVFYGVGRTWSMSMKIKF